MATAERWVSKWSSIVGLLEQNLTGSGGLLLNTVGDFVRGFHARGYSMGPVLGRPKGRPISVSAAGSGDTWSQVYHPAEWSVGACFSWYVCRGKTRRGAEVFVLCCRVHYSQLLNLALTHDTTPKSYRSYCSCQQRYETRWGQLVLLKMINDSLGLQEDQHMRVEWPDGKGGGGAACVLRLFGSRTMACAFGALVCKDRATTQSQVNKLRKLHRLSCHPDLAGGNKEASVYQNQTKDFAMFCFDRDAVARCSKQTLVSANATSSWEDAACERLLT